MIDPFRSWCSCFSALRPPRACQGSPPATSPLALQQTYRPLLGCHPHSLTAPVAPPPAPRPQHNTTQNILATSKIQNALAAKDMAQSGGGFENDDVYDGSTTTGFGGFDFDVQDAGVSDGGLEDDSDGDLDDGSYMDDADLRRKLNRLAGPGGAMEAESREAPHLFSPGGPLESPEMARAVGGAGGGGRLCCGCMMCAGRIVSSPVLQALRSRFHLIHR